jgi:hypothetical protein
MIGALFSILFVVIVLGILWWAAQRLLPLIPLGEPFRTIVYVLMVVIVALVALWVVWQILAATGLVSGRPFRADGEPSRAVAAVSAKAPGHLQGLLTKGGNYAAS